MTKCQPTDEIIEVILSPGIPVVPAPSMTKEHQYLATLANTCTIEDWRKICEKAVTCARDGDHRARDWICKYLVPEPQSVAHALHAHVNVDVEGKPIPDKYENVPTQLLLAAKSALLKVKEASEKNNFIP